jgi:hypothetical protein
MAFGTSSSIIESHITNVYDKLAVIGHVQHHVNEQIML